MELIQEGHLAITPVSVFELYAGVISRRRIKQIEDFVRSISVFPLNTIEAAAAAKIFTELKAKGELIGIQDILIAGICVVNYLPLLTRNVAHFSAIKNLKIVSV
jgi:predicted nucleic acid-binding protein